MVKYTEHKTGHFNHLKVNTQQGKTTAHLVLDHSLIPKENLISMSSHPPLPLPQSPATTNPTHSLSLWIGLFWAFPTDGSTYSGASGVWLLSLSIIILRIIRVLSVLIIHSFSQLCNIPCPLPWLYPHNVLIHSSVDRHPNPSQFGVIYK